MLGRYGRFLTLSAEALRHHNDVLRMPVASLLCLQPCNNTFGSRGKWRLSVKRDAPYPSVPERRILLEVVDGMHEGGYDTSK